MKSQTPNPKSQYPVPNIQPANQLEFSPGTRRANLERMKREVFDVLVIGGGITGAGVARDAALRGLTVALVEKEDFAAGTSSKTSRMVHGGLRYVAQGQFGVVAESCTERDRLWRQAPRLVWPTPFTTPVYERTRTDILLARIGLWLYDALSRFRTYRRHRILTSEQVLAAEPAVKQERMIGGAVYYDCRTDDARLTLAVVQAAHRHGACIANHAEVAGLLKEGDRVAGVQVLDHITGESFPARARVVVNATGPWSDRVRQMDDPGARAMMYPSRGSHVVLPRVRLGTRGTVTFMAGGRVRFAVEWGDTCIVGTTDPAHDGDLDRVAASAQEVDELLAAVNEAFPAAHVTRDDLVSTYSGVRPLVLEEGKEAYRVSRAHVVVESAAGLVTVAGGKLTTYRQMAQEAVDRVAHKLQAEFGVRAAWGCQTAQIPLDAPGFDLASEVAALVARYPQTPLDVVTHLALAYGPAASAVLALIEGDAELGERIVPGKPYIRAEVVYAMEHGMALTLDDVLVRRTRIVHEDEGQGLGCAAEVAALMAQVLGWGPAEVARQVDGYRQQVALTRAYRDE